MEVLKEEKSDSPLVKAFKAFVRDRKQQTALALQLQYNAVPFADRIVVFNAMSSQKDVLSAASSSGVSSFDVFSAKKATVEAQLQEETLRELLLGENIGVYVLLRVLHVQALNNKKTAILVQDAESSCVWMEQKGKSEAYHVGGLIIVPEPVFHLCFNDGRARIICANDECCIVVGEPEKKDLRFNRHPFVCGLCDVCGKQPEAKLVCEKCKIATFCSVECQKKSWPTHKQICKTNDIKI